MLSKFHKTTSECQQRTSGTQKSSPVSLKGGDLSMVLYRWRSLETTVKIRLKTRSRRLKSKSWEHQRTPDSREQKLICYAKSLQSCPTLGDPIDGSPPGSPSLGFSRQEHWSGLPFPSPMHESEKWKWSRSIMSDSYWPHGLQPTRLLHPWDFPGKSTGVGCHCLLR